MNHVIWSVRASEDLVRQIDYIAALNATAADRIGDAIEARAAWLAEWPRAGQALRSPNIRSFTVRGTPFVLIYRFNGDAVTILRIRRAAENWRPR